MDKEKDQDAVVFTDDNGEEITLHIVDYFLYNGDEYVILTDSDTEEWDEEEAGEGEEEDAEEDREPCGCCSSRDDACECGAGDGPCECEPEEVDVYVMRVNVVDDDNEEFVPVNPEEEEEILEYAEKFLNGELPDEAY